MPNSFHGRMSDFDKGQIIAFRRQNWLFSQIDKEIKRPKSTIQSFLDRYDNRDSHENTPSAARPLLMIARMRTRLVRESKKARRLPLRELTNEVAPNASVRTVMRVLAGGDVGEWMAKMRALLTGDHVAQRLAWAKKRKDLGKAD